MGRRIDACRAAALALVATTATAFGAELATDTPGATIATLHRGLVDLSAKQPNASLDERYGALVPLVEATHDLPYIAEFALRRQWPTLSAADRERFVAAFERLSVMTYASRFKNVTPATFKSTGSATAADGGRMQVATAIARPNAADVSLEYLLQQRPDGWKIINIVADGVSDLALKRAEYQRILASGTLDDLIKELDAQTARLR
ncbi:MAG TPA: ABC transporter substrate-binding protein [Gammaproteobacteria bacterium]|nr:ABC transporter substrate-binding protein [Gammaproteobacteria bacterium]